MERTRRVKAAPVTNDVVGSQPYVFDEVSGEEWSAILTGCQSQRVIVPNGGNRTPYEVLGALTFPNVFNEAGRPECMLVFRSSRDAQKAICVTHDGHVFEMPQMARECGFSGTLVARVGSCRV